jgi:pseudouridine-5'-phosphate glycosidase/pseudouridine kinase
LDSSCDNATLDGQFLKNYPEIGTSNPARIRQTLGGVGNNVSTAARLLDINVRLCSAVANDLAGQSILQSMRESGADVTAIQMLDQDSTTRTAQYIAVTNSQKDLFVGLADMDIMESPSLSFKSLLKPQLNLASSEWLVVDSNWNPAVIRSWISEGKKVSKVAFEPVSVSKSRRLFSTLENSSPQLGAFPNHHIDLCSPNSAELGAMYSAARESAMFDRPEWWNIVNKLNISSGGARDQLVRMTSTGLVDEGIPQQSIQLLPFMPCVLTKLGSKGVLLTEIMRSDDPRLSSPTAAPFILSRSEDDELVGGMYLRLFPPVEVVPQQDIVSVNGVGDTFLGVLLAGLCTSKDMDAERWIDLAQQGSVLTLKSSHSVASNLGTLKSQLIV